MRSRAFLSNLEHQQQKDNARLRTHDQQRRFRQSASLRPYQLRIDFDVDNNPRSP